MAEREAVEKLKNMRLFMQLEDNKNECKFTEDDYKANEMAYAGKCDRCGAFYDLPFEHGAAIRARIVDVFDDTVETMDLCSNCMNELHSFLGGAELNDD